MNTPRPATVAGNSSFPHLLHDEDGRILLQIARSEIVARLEQQSPVPVLAPLWMELPGASFVTLTTEGELRGCIGSLEAIRPLKTDIRENALAAAFMDPRFLPLRREELERIRIEVSLLSLPEPVMARCEAEAVAALRPGIDGVIFEYMRYRSTFLPQVWEQLPDPSQFLAYLRNKAGLPSDFWAEEVRMFRYTVRKWKEET
ncbi:MAG: AmmeMemoRadiSam system protein A [Nitrospirota bacterium]|nr:AmmeMemoRadiSam system protein A [Nitrospirota bacterium]